MRRKRRATGVKLFSSFIGIALFAVLGTSSASTAVSSLPSITYTISPKADAGQLTGILVEVMLPIGATGDVVLNLPEEWGGTDKLYRYLSPINVIGGSIVALSQTHLKVSAPPGRSVTLRYAVSSAYDHEPNAKDAILTAGPMIRSDWFTGMGDQFIVGLKDRDTAPATVRWKGWPKSWVTVSSEDARVSTVADVIGASFIAGREVMIRSRPISGGTLRFISHGSFEWNVDAYADRVARTIDAERRFWGGISGNYTVTMIGLAPSLGFSSSGGTGRNHGFVQYASPDTQMPVLERNIAHEHMHNWIPRQVGEMPDTDGEASVYWFSEGFTDFYTGRTLLRSGLWSPEQFTDNLNEVITRLATSKARNYTNAQAAKEAWSDQDVHQLAYDRGQLFAFLLDHALRQAGKRGLDSVMLLMRDRWQAAPANAKPPVIANLLSAADAVAFDMRPMLAKYIDAGETITLPADLFANCATIADVKLAEFDLGYDRVATGKSGGVFAGVQPDGPAYAAGLRDGMVRLAKLSGTMGVSTTAWSFRVRDGASERVITYYPRGKKLIDGQEMRLTASLSPSQRKQCALSMSGA
ncbi:putative metalloprotease with PDZ domain [Nitrospirillum amazonense]|uniref:Putative metalloprotease with PDZ domain n=2 Tax=Nitrospirillum amazonense TaxID=28077 RepID=A0A560JF21_9PROT|nr:putative metalloprotease with PDZ domain [Nitrospirillum amazonense]